MWRNAAFSTGVVLVVALVGVSVIGARRSTELGGVSRVEVTNDAVIFGLGTELVFADPQGDFRGVGRSPNGTPWRFEYVSSISTDGNGNVYAVDGDSGEIVRFGPDGTEGTTVHTELPPSRNRRILPLPDGRFFVADTSSHRIAVLDAEGAVIRERYVRYPNGLTLLRDRSTGRLVIYLVETGHRRLQAFDELLEPVETDLLVRARSALQSLGKPPAYRELLGLAADPQGRLVMLGCENTEGDCTVLRLEDSDTFEPIASLASLRTPSTDWGDSLMLVPQLAVGPDGRLFLPSSRLASLLVFERGEGGDGGALPDGFCSKCTTDEASPVPLSSIDGIPFSFPNGARVTVFGSPELRARFVAHQRARLFFDRVERVGRNGVMVFALGLMILLLVLRQSGAVDAARLDLRLRNVVSSLVRPSIGALVTTGAVIVVAGTAGALFGRLVAGTSGAVACGIGLAMLLSRTLAPRLFLAQCSPDAASQMWRLHFGTDAPAALPMGPGEKVEWCALGRQTQSSKELASEVRSAAEADDPLEILERLAPHLVLVTRTDRRLIFTRVSLLGAPMDAVTSVDVDNTTSAPEHSLSVAGWERQFHLPMRVRGERVLARRVSYLCERCFQPLGTCDHAGPESALLPLILSALVPGLGHLPQGRFRRARVVLISALGLAMAALYEIIPQAMGVLPYAPWRFSAAAIGYAIVLAGAMVDVAAWQLRLRRRSEINQELESSDGDYLDLAGSLRGP